MKENKKLYNPEITKEDLQILGDKEGNLRNDNGDDELLKFRKNNYDFDGKQLDVPGRKILKRSKKKLIKDEENQLYSLGSDDNENLEIDTVNYIDKQK